MSRSKSTACSLRAPSINVKAISNPATDGSIAINCRLFRSSLPRRSLWAFVAINLSRMGEKKESHGCPPV